MNALKIQKESQVWNASTLNLYKTLKELKFTSDFIFYQLHLFSCISSTSAGVPQTVPYFVHEHKVKGLMGIPSNSKDVLFSHSFWCGKNHSPVKLYNVLFSSRVSCGPQSLCALHTNTVLWLFPNFKYNPFLFLGLFLCEAVLWFPTLVPPLKCTP